MIKKPIIAITLVVHCFLGLFAANIEDEDSQFEIPLIFNTHSHKKPFTLPFFKTIYSNNNYCEINIQESEIEKKIDCSQQENIREILIGQCKNYLLILPKQMGCAVCQLTHSLLATDRYQHVKKRQQELETLIAMLDKKNFCPKDILCYLQNTMQPFKGRYGKQFYEQCKLQLDTVTNSIN